MIRRDIVSNYYCTSERVEQVFSLSDGNIFRQEDSYFLGFSESQLCNKTFWDSIAFDASGSFVLVLFICRK